MPLPVDYLDKIGKVRDRVHGPLVMPWPIPGNIGALECFATFQQWRQFIIQFSLKSAAPLIVSAKFERAQKLYILAWIDYDLIKAGELIALTALELALTDRYAGEEIKRRRTIVRDKASIEKREIKRSERIWCENISLTELLKYMMDHGLGDAPCPGAETV